LVADVVSDIAVVVSEVSVEVLVSLLLQEVIVKAKTAIKAGKIFLKENFEYIMIVVFSFIK
jgi:hypothetical protein